MNIQTESEPPLRTTLFSLAAITAVLLLIPLLAMQFTEEVNWNAADFVVMSVLLFGIGGAYVLLSRRVSKRRRVAIAAVLVGLFLYLWAELAVGIFTQLGS